MYPMDDSRIKSAANLLSRFFDEEKIKRGGSYASFFSSWKQIVGERLAAHSRIVELEKGVLIIEAEHPGWIQLLQLKQATILSALSSRFPELEFRAIAFRLARSDAGELDARPPEEGSASEFSTTPEGANSETNEREEPQTEGIHRLEDIADDRLRGLLAELKRSMDDSES